MPPPPLLVPSYSTSKMWIFDGRPTAAPLFIMLFKSLANMMDWSDLDLPFNSMSQWE